MRSQLGKLCQRRVQRKTVQLGLSVSGMVSFAVAALMLNVIFGVAVIGLACFALERRIAS